MLPGCLEGLRKAVDEHCGRTVGMGQLQVLRAQFQLGESAGTVPGFPVAAVLMGLRQLLADFRNLRDQGVRVVGPGQCGNTELFEPFAQAAVGFPHACVNQHPQIGGRRRPVEVLLERVHRAGRRCAVPGRNGIGRRCLKKDAFGREIANQPQEKMNELLVPGSRTHGVGGDRPLPVLADEHELKRSPCGEIAAACGAKPDQGGAAVRQHPVFPGESRLRRRKQRRQAGLEYVRQRPRGFDRRDQSAGDVRAELESALLRPGACLAYKVIDHRRLFRDGVKLGPHFPGIELALVIDADQALARDFFHLGVEVEVFRQLKVRELLGPQAFLHVGVARHPLRQPRRGADHTGHHPVRNPPGASGNVVQDQPQGGYEQQRGDRGEQDPERQRGRHRNQRLGGNAVAQHQRSNAGEGGDCRNQYRAETGNGGVDQGVRHVVARGPKAIDAMNQHQRGIHDHA